MLCAVVQSRRAGVCAAIDATIVERAAPAVGEGVVAEIVSARGFGFVARLFEGGKREKLFFHVSHVVPSTTATTDQGAGNAPAISKGDEVRFEVGAHEKTGRPMALRVTVLPKGTLDLSGLRNNKPPSPPACQGIVLMEPSHTVLSNTPTHATTTRRHVDAVVGSPGGGRWDKVDADPHRHKKQQQPYATNMKEEGVLLLVSDPHGLFATETKRDRSPSVGGGETKDRSASVGGETPEVGEDAPRCSACATAWSTWRPAAPMRRRDAETSCPSSGARAASPRTCARRDRATPSSSAASCGASTASRERPRWSFPEARTSEFFLNLF